jgi:hypothetical protein
MATSFGVQNLTLTPVRPVGSRPTTTPAAGTAMPAVAAVGATPATPIDPLYGPPPPRAPVTVNLQVDGQSMRGVTA